MTQKNRFKGTIKYKSNQEDELSYNNKKEHNNTNDIVFKYLPILFNSCLQNFNYFIYIQSSEEDQNLDKYKRLALKLFTFY